MPNRRKRQSPKRHRGCNARRLRKNKREQRPVSVPYPRSEPIPEKDLALFEGLPSWGYPLAMEIISKKEKDNGTQVLDSAND